MAKDTKMKTIDERAEEFGKRGCGENCIFICEEWKDKNGVCRRLARHVALYKSIATEQRAIDEESYTNEMRKLNEEWEANLAECKRQRDAYHDELTRLRQERAELIDKKNAQKAFAELLAVQYGEDCDESMHQYIDDALKKAMEG